MEYHLSHYFFYIWAYQIKEGYYVFYLHEPMDGLVFKAALKSVESGLRNVS